MTTPTPEERAAEIAAVWTEGVCGDGAVILRDGEPMAIGDVLDVLNRIVPRLRSAEQEAYKRGVEDAANIADDYALHSIDLTKEFRAFGAAIRKAVEEEREACASIVDPPSGQPMTDAAELVGLR